MTLQEYAILHADEYAQKATEANEAGKTLAIKNKKLILVDIEIPIVELKRAKRAEIKQAYNDTISGSFDVSGTKWHCDFDTITKLDYALRQRQIDGLTSVVFFDFDAVPHEVTRQQANDIIYAIGANYQAQLVKRNTLYAQVENAETKEAVEAIQWL
jgi:hypothetical protein